MTRDLIKYNLFVVGMLLTVLISFQAFGQGDDIARARAYYAEGQENFDNGDLEGALSAFSKSFEAFPHFRTIFNIGLCYEKLGDGVKAVDMYQRYLDWPSEVPNRDEVSRKVMDLKKKYQLEDPEPPVPETVPAEEPPDQPPEEQPLVEAPPKVPPVEEQSGPEIRLTGDTGDTEKNRTVNLSSWVLMGTGVAGLATGVALLGLARSKQQDMRDAERDGSRYSPSIHDALKRDGERFQLAGWITGAFGVGTLAAGTTLALLSRFKPEIFSRFSVDAAVSSRGARANFVLRF